jgi:hypothetical protein
MAALKQSEEAQTLTGVVVGTASDRSLLAATDKEQQRRCGAARLTRRELALLAALLIAGAAAVALAAALGVERSREGKCIPPVCMHALGGGPVRSGGGVDSVTAASCKQELRAYGDTNGAYWKVCASAVWLRCEGLGPPGQGQSPIVNGDVLPCSCDAGGAAGDRLGQPRLWVCKRRGRQQQRPRCTTAAGGWRGSWRHEQDLAVGSP